MAFAILGEDTLVMEDLKQIVESGVKPPFALCDFALAKTWLGLKDEAVAELMAGATPASVSYDFH